MLRVLDLFSSIGGFSLTLIDSVKRFLWRVGVNQRAYEAKQIRRDIIREGEINQKRQREFRSKMHQEGWSDVPLSSHSDPKFHPTEVYEFTRIEWDEPSTFCLWDQDRRFNIAGLYYRPLDPHS